MQHHFKPFVDFLCLVPFIGLLGCVFILDHQFTGGTGVGKTVGFYAVMGLVPLATSLSYWNNRGSLKYQMTDWLVPVLALLGIGMTYAFHAVWNTKMVTLILLVMLYFSLRVFLVQRKANLRVLLLVFMATGLVEAAWGLLQLYGRLPSQHALFRVTGSFFNPGPYAGYLAMVLPLALFYTIRDWLLIQGAFRKKRLYHYFRWSIALLTLIFTSLILPATMSRAAWLAGGTGGTFVVLAFLIRHKRYGAGISRTLLTKKGIALSLSVLLLAGIALLGMYHLKQDSADGRALIWRISTDIAKREWPGIGLGYFSAVYGRAQGDYFASGRGTEQEKLLAGEPEYAFNEFIQVFVELGLLPFVFLVIILAYAFVAGVRRGKFAEVGGLAALLVFASMSYPFSLMPFLVGLILLLTACVSVHYRFTDIHDFGYQYLFNYKIRRRWNDVWILSLLLLCWVSVACCLYSRYPVYLAHKQWGQTRVFYHNHAYEEVVIRYRDLLPYLGDQVHYLFEYGQALSKTERYQESNGVIGRATRISGDPMLHIVIGKNYMALDQYEAAASQFKQAAQRVPHRLYPDYLMAKAYYEAGDLDNARKTAGFALKKKVKVDSPATRQMKTELQELIDRVALEIENRPKKMPYLRIEIK